MQVVIGAGEVGQAIAEVLSTTHETHLRDVEPSGPVRADVLHICYPWTRDFTFNTCAYQRQYEAELVIVHSTVPVWTCDRQGWAHSPVRGRHPHLAESVRRFVKFFGGASAGEAADIFRACGVVCETVPRAAETESGKLWELTQYGLAIVIEKQIHEYCADEGLDFETVYTCFAESYNDGYESLREPQFVRPVLRHIPGPIGGHCVVPGAKLLNHPLGEMVAEYGS